MIIVFCYAVLYQMQWKCQIIIPNSIIINSTYERFCHHVGSLKKPIRSNKLQSLIRLNEKFVSQWIVVYNKDTVASQKKRGCYSFHVCRLADVGTIAGLGRYLTLADSCSRPPTPVWCLLGAQSFYCLR